MKTDEPLPPPGRCRSCGGVLRGEPGFTCWLCALWARLYPPRYRQN